LNDAICVVPTPGLPTGIDDVSTPSHAVRAVGDDGDRVEQKL
jgi:hypothetical protein